MSAPIVGASAQATEATTKPGDPGQQREPTSHAVAQRPRDELAGGEPEQERRERELHRGRARVQRALHVRPPGQVHVDRERHERPEAPEEHHEARGDCGLSLRAVTRAP